MNTKENLTTSISTNGSKPVTARELYAAIPLNKREVGEAHFCRNLKRGLSPDEACLSRAHQSTRGGFIYRIRHISTGRKYIGVTTTPGQRHRFDGHVGDARKGRGSELSLEEAIRQENFKKGAFNVEVLCSTKGNELIEEHKFISIDCIKSRALKPYKCHDNEELRAMERQLIKQHNTISPAGFNLDRGGSLGSLFNAKPITVNGQRFETTNEACTAFNVERAVFNHRCRAGWTIKQALGIDPTPERTDLELFVVEGQRVRGRELLRHDHRHVHPDRG